jgi:hypothetical protein
VRRIFVQLPPMDENHLTAEEQEAVNRAGAPYEVALMQKYGDASLAQASEMTKWLLGALLAINAGGAVAVTNLGDTFLATMPAVWFGLGIMAALLSAWIIQVTGQSIMPHVQRQTGYWLSVAADGFRSPDLEDRHRREMSPVIRFGRAAPLAGLISALCFAIGAYHLSFAKEGTASSRNRCLAIQTDMLSSRPKRTDDVAIFQALGCRQQGDGSVYATTRRTAK